MKYITRTVKVTTVFANRITYANGKISTEALEPFTMDGNPKSEDVLKACRKRFGKLDQYVFETKEINTKYGMPIAKFMEYAENLDDKEIDEE